MSIRSQDKRVAYGGKYSSGGEFTELSGAGAFRDQGSDRTPQPGHKNVGRMFGQKESYQAVYVPQKYSGDSASLEPKRRLNQYAREIVSPAFADYDRSTRCPLRRCGSQTRSITLPSSTRVRSAGSPKASPRSCRPRKSTSSSPWTTSRTHRPSSLPP